MILLIDNYDSFTYNLVHRIGEIDASIPIEVVRNDQITIEQAEEMQPTHLIISPGPCTPRQSGISPLLIQRFKGRIPILGVCLGHQAIADVHGMIVKPHSILMHGKTSEIHHDNRGIFQGLPNPFVAARYHSLIVDRDSLSDEFEISAWTAGGVGGVGGEGEIMGLRWRRGKALDGVQFHPESFLTPDGTALLANFLASRASMEVASQGMSASRPH